MRLGTVARAGGCSGDRSGFAVSVVPSLPQLLHAKERKRAVVDPAPPAMRTGPCGHMVQGETLGCDKDSFVTKLSALRASVTPLARLF